MYMYKIQENKIKFMVKINDQSGDVHATTSDSRISLVPRPILSPARIAYSIRTGRLAMNAFTFRGMLAEVFAVRSAPNHLAVAFLQNREC